MGVQRNRQTNSVSGYKMSLNGPVFSVSAFLRNQVSVSCCLSSGFRIWPILFAGCREQGYFRQQKSKMMKNFLRLAMAATLLTAFAGLVWNCSDEDEEELVGNWVKVSDFDGVARCSAVTFTVDGTVYVAAGGYGGYKYRLNDLWMFNEDSGTWTQKASMTGAARTYAVGFASDRYGYVGLGYDGDNYLKDFWRYDPASNTWTEVSEFGGSARRAAVAFSVQGTGYVGCGYDGNHLKDFWKYNEASDTWEAITSIGGSKRIGASSFVIDDVAYVVGGENNSETVTDFWAYDASTDTWIEKRKIANVSDDEYDDDYSTIARSYGVAFTMYGLGYFTCGRMPVREGPPHGNTIRSMTSGRKDRHSRVAPAVRPWDFPSITEDMSLPGKAVLPSMMTCGSFFLRMNTMRTINRKRSVLSGTVILCIVVILPAVMSYLHHDRAYHSVLFRQGEGWGYDIFYNGRKIIHQPYVPAIPGNNPFPDRRSARKTGMYVMSKIRSGSSPAVSAEEIEDFMPKSRR